LSTSSLSSMVATPPAQSSVGSGANTPVSQRGTPGPSGAFASAMVSKKPSVQSIKSALGSAPSKSLLASKHSSAAMPKPNRASTANGKTVKCSLPSSQPSTKTQASHSTLPKKRTRSESRSESPPLKRRGYVEEDDEVPGNISSMIWNMFGRDRDRYMSMDVFSDEEDMEADATTVAREEARSSRIALTEDQLALEDERRHEDEKRRRKKEREARAMSSR